LNQRLVLALVYIAVLFLDRLDVTIINVITPAIAKELGKSVLEVEWVSTAFILALAVTMPITAWFEKKAGSRNTFLSALFLFTISSFLCYLSTTLHTLIFFRILQGIGTGILLPVGMGMIYRVFTKNEYAHVANYTLMPTLLAPAFAPVLGGVFAEFLDWRYIFLINIPVGICAILFTFFFISDIKTTQTNSTPPLDLWGFILISTGLVCLFYSFNLISKFGLSNSMAHIYGASFFVLFICFIIRQKRAKHPLINISFFKIPLFSQSHIMVFCLQCCYYGSVFLITLYLQLCIGMEPVIAGVTMLPQAVGTILMLPVSAWMFKRFGPKSPFIMGFIGIGASNLLLLTIQTPHDVILAGSILFFRGMAISFLNGSTQASCMLDIPKEDTTKAGIIFNSTRQIAIGFGIVLSSICLSFHGTNLNIKTDFLSKHIFENTFLVFTGIALLGMIVACTVNNKHVLEKIKETGS